MKDGLLSLAGWATSHIFVDLVDHVGGLLGFYVLTNIAYAAQIYVMMLRKFNINYGAKHRTGLIV